MCLDIFTNVKLKMVLFYWQIIQFISKVKRFWHQNEHFKLEMNKKYLEIGLINLYSFKRQILIVEVAYIPDVLLAKISHFPISIQNP